ncbi:MAG: HvfA family oxazolone/thioamide-modified RiPP metallophore [Gammaproteobacteria bacterium]
MKKMNKTPLVLAMGSAVVSTFAATAAHAEANPFGMTELSSGYMQVAEAKQAGEMKCGANMGTEGKCGASMNMGTPKMPEGKCAGQPPQKKAKEASCGEGKCGAMMENGKMKKGMEGACGEMMKGKEGACGEMMKGMKGQQGSTAEKIDKDKAAGQ